MKTHCKSEALLFQTETKRELVAHFDGGNICSDAGGLLLQQTERITGIIKRFAVWLSRANGTVMTSDLSS